MEPASDEEEDTDQGKITPHISKQYLLIFFVAWVINSDYGSVFVLVFAWLEALVHQALFHILEQASLGLIQLSVSGL